MPNNTEEQLQRITRQIEYLNRLKHCAEQDKDKKRLEYYRKQIEETKKQRNQLLKEMNIEC